RDLDLGARRFGVEQRRAFYRQHLHSWLELGNRLSNLAHDCRARLAYRRVDEVPDLGPETGAQRIGALRRGQNDRDALVDVVHALDHLAEPGARRAGRVELYRPVG